MEKENLCEMLKVCYFHPKTNVIEINGLKKINLKLLKLGVILYLPFMSLAILIMIKIMF